MLGAASPDHFGMHWEVAAYRSPISPQACGVGAGTVVYPSVRGRRLSGRSHIGQELMLTAIGCRDRLGYRRQHRRRNRFTKGGWTDERDQQIHRLGEYVEVLRDLIDPRARITVTSHPHDIITELTRLGLGYSNILPARHQGKPSQMSPIGAANPAMPDAGEAWGDRA